MDYGICTLSNIPIRISSDPKSEVISELLFGDHFKILEKLKDYYKIRVAYDNCEGYIKALQATHISKEDFDALDTTSPFYCNNLIDFVEDSEANLFPILLGSRLPEYSGHSFKIKQRNYIFEGNIITDKGTKPAIVKTAFMYLNSPFLEGGKTPFGIDAAGFTQMTYKMNGHQLPREVALQATKGEVLSFIEESEAGDLAFFDDKEGTIVHTGIILANNYIIHAYGSVRIDRLDQTGIYNNDQKKHTHRLRVIKKIF